MAELDVVHLSLRFGGLTVLEDVSFSVAAGELFALIGPNGAGKTSALNCISGIYRGSGAIRFRGEDIAGRAPHEIARLGLARTFQHGELFPQMSVLDNLLTGRHARIRTNPVAEMLFLPNVRRAEIAHREAVERSSALPVRLRSSPLSCCSTSHRPASTARSARISRASSCASSTN
jgi:branched-chain amino acid transport system ATP-binding protein